MLQRPIIVSNKPIVIYFPMQERCNKMQLFAFRAIMESCSLLLSCTDD